jgi:hypothetical protein
MSSAPDVEIALAGWTTEQREGLGFLLGDAGIDCTWRADAVVVRPGGEEEARRLVEYLSASGDAQDDSSPVDGGLVYPLFEAIDGVTIADATSEDLFSFCFSAAEVPRAFAGLGEVSSIAHDAKGHSIVKVSLETRAGPLERVYEELERTPPSHVVARGTDSWGQAWRETWSFDGSGRDVVVSLAVAVEVADPARAPDQMRSFRSDWFAHRFVTRRLGAIKTEYELGIAADPQTF